MDRVAKSASRLRIAAMVAIATAAAALSAPAVADPLHGYCSGAGQCVDNGTNSPTSTNPPANFGFTVSPGPKSGDLMIDILAPNNVASGPSYALSGTLVGTATLFSATAWSSGSLASYLSLSGGASPSNPIGAYLPSTQALDPGASGFMVYTVDLGKTTLQGASNPGVSPLETLGSSLPIGSYIVGFFNEKPVGTPPAWIATANSGAIFETGPSSVPEPATLGLLGPTLIGVAMALRARRRRRG
jgi:hypothetical protein